MMGLGLTTLIIALVALPGLIVATVVRDAHDTAPPVFMDAGWKTLSSSMLAALVIHCVMIAASDLIAGHFPVPAPDLVAAGMLLAGTDTQTIEQILEAVVSDFWWTVGYFVGTVLLAVGFARLIIRFTPSTHNWLERQIEELRLDEANELLWITIALETDGATWLFAGIYDRHENDEMGQPDIVFLTYAQRILFSANPNDEEWIPVPGESLGLKLRGWHSLNVDWFEVD